jgi:hypothetical protein
VARRLLGEHLFVDVGQRALEADPTGIAEQVYRHADLDLDESARNTVDRWAAENQPGSRGHHVHKPDDFGPPVKTFAMRSQNIVMPSRSTCDDARPGMSSFSFRARKRRDPVGRAQGENATPAITRIGSIRVSDVHARELVEQFLHARQHIVLSLDVHGDVRCAFGLP